MAWRTGRTLGVTIYKDDTFVATAQTQESAAEIVAGMNAQQAEAAVIVEQARTSGEAQHYFVTHRTYTGCGFVWHTLVGK
jgi:hypothetical protein